MCTRAAAVALVLAFAAHASAQSISTIFQGGNRGSPGGAVYFDVTINSESLTIVGFDVNTTQPAGTTFGFSVYTLTGTSSGNQNNAGAWTIRTTGVGTAAGTGVPSAVTLDLPFDLDANTQYGMAIVLESPGQVAGQHEYTNGTGANQFYSNSDLSLSLGSATNSPFSGNIFDPRVWNGTIHYTPAGPATPGACCFPDGSCQDLLGSDCFAQGGSFQGGGTDCASVSCPQPGACCFVHDPCQDLLETTCNTQGGNWQGANTDCASTTCPTPGACCLPDAHCVSVLESDCNAFGGTFGGVGSDCAAQTCTPPLFSNGEMITNPDQGHGGAHISRAGTTITAAGSNATQSGAGPHFRVADDFEVVDADGWSIDGVIVYGYSTSTTHPDPPVSPVTSADVNIWDGPPGEPGASVVASTTDLVATGWTGIYRIFNTGLFTNRDRPIMFVHVEFENLHLAQGTYWVDYQFAGSMGTVWTPYVMEVDRFGEPVTPMGNSRMLFDTGWAPTGTSTGLAYDTEFPMAVLGSVGSACYPDCNGDGTLNVNDFLCFIDKFAVQDPYADCNGDNVFNINDFLCFIDEFAVGCP